MFSTIVPAVLLGAAAVSAKPVAFGPLGGSNWGGPSPSSYSSVSSTASSSGSGQTPFTFPLADGFPNLNNATTLDIEEAAHGILPNGPPNGPISDTTDTVFELIAFNEIFEVAYFSSLLSNITNNVSGYEIDSAVLRNFVIRALTAVIPQEEEHFLGANSILSAAGRDTIQPCEYVFPVDNFDDAIALASKFTDVVLGTLQDAQNAFATDGDSEFVALIGSVIGQEGEQNGYYRSLLNLIPSAAPFLTRSAAPFAFSALNQNFVKAGTCPGAANNELFKSIPIFGVLNVLTQNIQLEDQTLTFQVTTNSSDSDIKDYQVTYLNQQNVPVVEPITNIKYGSDNVVTFDAFFPAGTLIMDSLTISAVTQNASASDNADVIASKTLFGPGLIEIN